jgi:hypothetical protein
MPEIDDVTAILSRFGRWTVLCASLWGGLSSDRRLGSSFQLRSASLCWRGRALNFTNLTSNAAQNLPADATRSVSVPFKHRPAGETLGVKFSASTLADLNAFTLSQ